MKFKKFFEKLFFGPSLLLGVIIFILILISIGPLGIIGIILKIIKL